MGRSNEVSALRTIDVLEDLCEKIQSGNYDIEEIYEECQRRIAEIKVV